MIMRLGRNAFRVASPMLLAAVVVEAVAACSSPSAMPGPTTSSIAVPTTLPTVAVPSQQTPAPPPPPPSEQLAADRALAAYREYVGVPNRVGQSGWKQTDSLSTVAVGEELQLQKVAALKNAGQGLRQVGAVQIVSATPDLVTLTTDPSKNVVPEVRLATCEDSSTAYAVDASGSSVRPSSAPTHFRWAVVVRYYPKLGAGSADGWYVAKTTGQGVAAC